MFKWSRNSNGRGFTLIEMVLVILIIGFLAAISLPKFQSLATKAQKATIEDLVQQIETSSKNNRMLHKSKVGGFAVTNNDVCTYESIERFLQGPIDRDKVIISSLGFPFSSCQPGAVADTYEAMCGIDASTPMDGSDAHMSGFSVSCSH